MHGWGGEIASFKGLADALSTRFRVTLVDLYGFGKTPHPDLPLTIEDYAVGVEEVIEQTGGGDVILIAHSFGGRVAMRISARNPAVKGLILIDSAGIIPHRGIGYYLSVGVYKLKKKIGSKSLPKGSSDYAVLSGPMRKTFVNVVNESSERDAKKITVPTILLWGTEDKDTPMYMCRRLHKLIHGSEVLIFSGAGHFSYLERSGEVARIVKAFAEGV